MAHIKILTRVEIESLGPPTPEELADTGVHEQFLCDLALKHLAMLAEPTTTSVADRLHLPRALTEDLLYQLYREKLVYSLCDARSWLGTARSIAVAVWLSGPGACVPCRLHPHDAATGRAFTAGIN